MVDPRAGDNSRAVKVGGEHQSGSAYCGSRAAILAVHRPGFHFSISLLKFGTEIRHAQRRHHQQPQDFSLSQPR